MAVKQTKNNQIKSRTVTTYSLSVKSENDCCLSVHPEDLAKYCRNQTLLFRDVRTGHSKVLSYYFRVKLPGILLPLEARGKEISVHKSILLKVFDFVMDSKKNNCRVASLKKKENNIINKVLSFSWFMVILKLYILVISTEKKF